MSLVTPGMTCGSFKMQACFWEGSGFIGFLQRVPYRDPKRFLKRVTGFRVQGLIGSGLIWGVGGFGGSRVWEFGVC